MNVTVIIPVYNHALYLVQAVESALIQPETSEVILVEDRSPDNSLDICLSLAAKYDKVRIIRHPNDENRGTPSSRNLGIKNAKFDYIALLDDDDYFLPARFAYAKEIFSTFPICEGVYEAIGITFEDEHAEKQWASSMMGNERMTTIVQEIPPEELFEQLVSRRIGHIHLNGLVFKKSVIKKTGYFDETQLMHDDTDFIYKLSAVGILMPGRLNEPVGIRRVHGENRISASRTNRQVYKERMKMWISVYHWIKRNDLKERISILCRAMAGFCMDNPHYDIPLRTIKPNFLLFRLRLLFTAFEYPELLFESSFLRAFLPYKWTK